MRLIAGSSLFVLAGHAVAAAAAAAGAAGSCSTAPLDPQTAQALGLGSQTGASTPAAMMPGVRAATTPGGIRRRDEFAKSLDRRGGGGGKSPRGVTSGGQNVAPSTPKSPGDFEDVSLVSIESGPDSSRYFDAETTSGVGSARYNGARITPSNGRDNLRNGPQPLLPVTHADAAAQTNPSVMASAMQSAGGCFRSICQLPRKLFNNRAFNSLTGAKSLEATHANKLRNDWARAAVSLFTAFAVATITVSVTKAQSRENRDLQIAVMRCLIPHTGEQSAFCAGLANPQGPAGLWRRSPRALPAQSCPKLSQQQMSNAMFKLLQAVVEEMADGTFSGRTGLVMNGENYIIADRTKFGVQPSSSNARSAIGAAPDAGRRAVPGHVATVPALAAAGRAPQVRGALPRHDKY